MKHFLSIFFLLMAFASFAQVEKVIPARPNPPKLVNDLTGNFLTPEQVAALEQKLVAYDDSTSNQVAVVVVNDLKGYSAADYAIALGRSWGVGNKNFDNGIVVLISTGGGSGNRDAFIAVGYGLEGVIPDLTADAILNNELIPNFKAGNYYRGLDEATNAIFKAAEGRYKAPEGYRKRGGGKGIPPIIIILLVIGLLAIFGGIGGGGGGYVSRRGYRDWPGGGWIGGGGWSGGGGGGGFGGGGGGFGGFGGGGFGGGGAGGKW
ncbi:MAG: TPM domain-containing protein [Chitinophagaceae bacterium]|nr:TPM domain-containing protein [Chitinophagaceae bacterium]